MNKNMERFKDFNAERRNGTVLFCDIRNFTHLFEEDPFKAVIFANSVLARTGYNSRAGWRQCRSFYGRWVFGSFWNFRG